MAFFSSSAAKPHVHPVGDRCPTCDQPIPNDRIAEVKGRIAARERELKAEFEARVNGGVEAARAALTMEFAARADAIRKEVEQRAAETGAAKLKEASDARLAAEHKIADLQQAQDAVVAARVLEAREASEKDRANALGAAQAKHFEEMQKARKLVDDLQRKLENRTAEDLGEGAEVDLFEALKGAFQADYLRRVGRGNAGADIIHEVRHNGQTCGVIVYDSKNHQQWRTEHATKLRDDKIAAKADHAVLATRAFPAGKQQLHIDFGVVVCNPARAAVVAFLLREQIVRMHALKVSSEARDSKTEELYSLMTSERFAEFMSGVEKTLKQLEALQEAERKQHESTWKKQGEFYRTIIRTCAQFDETVARIIGTGAA